MKIESIDDVHNYLDAIPPFKERGEKAADFTLDRFRNYCREAGNPQDRFPSIHVAGSNGKGSVCQIISSIYHEAGYNVGVFTSPHLLRYNERFVINGKQIKDEELTEFFRSHRILIERFHLTYFEVCTALAFWWFARREIDIAVIEVGLGGRLDATNVIHPLASVITTITYDHMNILGDTIAEITAEKAGIVKENTPVIVGNIPDEARSVIAEKARAMNASVFDSLMSYQPQAKNGSYVLHVGDERLVLESTLNAPIQAFNIGVAWQLSDVLQQTLPVKDEYRKQGIRKAGHLFKHTGRFEKLHPELNWYFDGGHNLQAIRVMKKMIKKRWKIEEPVLILSLMEDKVRKNMMEEFLDFKKICYHSLPLKRAATLEHIQQWLPEVQPFPVEKNARNRLFNEFESKLVIFAGSFYFYPTVVNWLTDFMERL